MNEIKKVMKTGQKFNDKQRRSNNYYEVMRATDYTLKSSAVDSQMTINYQAKNSVLQSWDKKQGYMKSDKNGIFVEGTYKCNKLVQDGIKELGGVDIRVKTDNKYQGQPNTTYLLDKSKTIQNRQPNPNVNQVKDIQPNLPSKYITKTVRRSEMNSFKQELQHKVSIITYKNDDGTSGHTKLYTADGTTLQAPSNSLVRAQKFKPLKQINSKNKATLRQVKTEKKMVDFQEKSIKKNYTGQIKEMASISLASNAGSQIVHYLNGNKKFGQAVQDLTINTAKSTSVSFVCNQVDQIAGLCQGQSSQLVGNVGLGIGIGMTLVNVFQAKTPQKKFQCAVKGAANIGLSYAGNVVGASIGTAVGGPIGTYVGSFIGGTIGGIIGSIFR